MYIHTQSTSVSFSGSRGSAIFVHWHSDVAVCFGKKMAGCIGSEFLVIAGGLPCLKMLWNKYTKSCIHSCGLFTVIPWYLWLYCVEYSLSFRFPCPMLHVSLKVGGAMPPAPPPWFHRLCSLNKLVTGCDSRIPIDTLIIRR